MKSTSRFLAMLAVPLMAAAFQPAPAGAEEFPTRAVTIVVPLPPGGSSDTLARMMQQGMTETLGQPVVVENRAGGGGSIGVDYVVRAEPDGYTILFTPMGNVTINPAILPNIAYDPVEDLTAIARLANNVIGFAVNPDLGIDTFEEFIEHVRANPDSIGYGTSGVASGHHIAGEMLNRAAGISMEHIPYAGDGQAVTDLVGGHLEASFGTLPVLLPHQNGGVKIIALAENRRLPSMPDVPAMTETVEMDLKDRWIGLFAPAGTPPQIVAKLNEAAVAALGKPEIVAEIEAMGLFVNIGSGEELQAQVAEEVAYWKETLPALGIQP